MSLTQERLNVIVDRSPELRRGIPASVPPAGGSVGARITSRDVEEGERGSGNACPLALIIIRTFSNVASVNLSGEHPSFTDVNGVTHALNLHEAIVDWIGRFDRGEPVEEVEIIFST